MPERDLVYLKQIMDCIFDLELFVKDCNENSFIADKKTQSAAIRMLELIGEVTKRLSDELKHNNQNIAWKKIAGLRDVLIHNYEGVDISAVWQIIQINIPELKKQIQSLIQKYN